VALAELAASARLLVLGRSTESPDRGSFGTGGWSAIVRARVTTVVVPESGPEGVAGPVVVGVDGSPLSRAALEFGFGYAAAHQLSLVAVHATGSAEDGWRDWSPPGDRDCDPEQLLATELAAWRIRHPRVRVSERVSGRPATAAVTDAAAGAGLLVLGARGNGPPVGALGSLARTAVGYARCPVAVVRTS
jgi:nucleotide-binding universal stress UspA family protein